MRDTSITTQTGPRLTLAPDPDSAAYRQHEGESETPSHDPSITTQIEPCL